MATASKHSSVPANYEVALQELEQLVARLESGDMPWSNYSLNTNVVQNC